MQRLRNRLDRSPRDEERVDRAIDCCDRGGDHRQPASTAHFASNRYEQQLVFSAASSQIGLSEDICRPCKIQQLDAIVEQNNNEPRIGSFNHNIVVSATTV